MGNCNDSCSGNGRKKKVLTENKKIETSEERIETFTIDKDLFNNKTSLTINFPIEKIKIRYLDDNYLDGNYLKDNNYPKFRLIICEIPAFFDSFDDLDNNHNISNFNFESVAYIKTGYSTKGELNFNNDIISEENKNDLNKDCHIPLTDSKRKNYLFLYGFYVTIEFTNNLYDFDIEVSVEGIDIMYYLLKNNELTKEWKNKNGITYII